MTIRILIFLGLLLGSSGQIFADRGDDNLQALKDRIAIIKGESPQIQSFAGVPIKCGTPEILSAFNYLQNNQDPQLAEAVERPSLPYTFPTQNFLIHYDTEGTDAVYSAGTDIDPADGVPDYVNRMGEIFEHTWSIVVDELGYLPPPADRNNGGDGKFDVYAVNLGFGFFGFTVPESIATGHTAFSYILVENDYAESPSYGTRPLEGLRVTAAHEFFHAIQFGYDAFEFENWEDNDPNNDKPWWLEASSTWMEDIVYDDINDYTGYLGFFYRYPWMSLATFSPFGNIRAYHPYASCVWPIYLSERYDDLSIVREIWERCADVEGYNVLPATDDALSFRGSNLHNGFLEFSVWNFHTGPFADTTLYYSEGNTFPVADTTILVENLNIAPYYQIPEVAYPPEDLSSNIIIIRPNPVLGGINIQFDGSDFQDKTWGVGVVGYRPQTGLWTDIPLAPETWNGTGEWRNWNSYQAVVVIPVITGFTAEEEVGRTYTGRFYYDSTLYLQQDVGANRFLAPSGAGRRGDPITPVVQYSNQGRESATFQARLIITDSSLTDVVYNRTLAITSLPADDAINVEFPSFTPTGINIRYVLRAIVEYSGDQLARNDTITTYYRSIGGIGRLLTAYPSPYVIDNSSILTIPYSYNTSDPSATLYIYDVSGVLVREIRAGRHPAGGTTFLGFLWDGKNENGDYVASGVYIYMINSKEDSHTGKIAVINKL